DRGRDLPQLALARAPATRDDAVRAGTASPGLACTVEQDVAGEQLVLRDGRGRDDRLRAIAAVLGTDPALRVDQHVELHLATEVRAPNAESRVQHLQELIVVCGQDGARLAAG